MHATLQINALQYCFTFHDAMETLEAFPTSIEDVYRRTWDRIVQSGPLQASISQATFTWVLNAKQSMTIGQLRHALATSPETYRFESARLMSEAVLLATCRGLITVDKESKIVRLVRKSVGLLHLSH